MVTGLVEITQTLDKSTYVSGGKKVLHHGGSSLSESVNTKETSVRMPFLYTLLHHFHPYLSNVSVIDRCYCTIEPCQ